DSRGIGAARRWIRSEFDRVAAACGGCLEVSYTASVDTVRGGGAVSASTTLAWEPGAADPNLAGYRVYWRDTTAPQWTDSRFVGKVSRFTLENVIIDNHLFGVAAVGANGTESPVVFAGVPMR
ncbi:MAG: hypothetical protein ACYC2G_16125, partial [Gemmatimonadaceae bacterium]